VEMASSPAAGNGDTLRFQVTFARTGERIAVDLPLNQDTVLGLQQALELKTGVATKGQILLYGPPFVKLDDKKRLFHHGLPTPTKSIFLYDKPLFSELPALDDMHKPKDVEMLERDSFRPRNMAHSTAFVTKFERLDKPDESRLYSLLLYEKNSNRRTGRGQQLVEFCRLKKNATEACIARQEGQNNAINAAVSSCTGLDDAVRQRHAKWAEIFKDSRPKFQSLLEGFEDNLAAVGRVKLHPSIHPAGISNTNLSGEAVEAKEKKGSVHESKDSCSLLDIITADKAKKWHETCKSAFVELSTKSETLAELCTSLAQEMQAGVASCGQRASSIMAESTEVARTIYEMFDALQSSQQKLNVQSEQLDATLSKVSNDLSLVDSQGLLDPLSHVEKAQKEVLESMESSVEGPFLAQLKVIVGKRMSFQAEMRSELRRVAELQSKYQKARQLQSAVKAMFEGTSTYFKQLEHLHMLPQAYKECLIEVSQRRNYNTLFQNKVNAMLDTIATLRDEEGKRRSTFRKTYGVHIPANIFPGLLGGVQEKPPQCEVIFDSSLDKDLPAIDLADLAGPTLTTANAAGNTNVYLQSFSEQHAEVRRSLTALPTMSRGLSAESAGAGVDTASMNSSTDDMVAFAVALDGVDSNAGEGTTHPLNNEMEKARQERASAAGKRIMKLEHEIMCLRQRLYGENLHFGVSKEDTSSHGSSPTVSLADSEKDRESRGSRAMATIPSGDTAANMENLKNEISHLKSKLADAITSAGLLQSENVSKSEEIRLLTQKMIKMSDEMSVLREECGEARRQAAEFDAKLRTAEATAFEAKLRSTEDILSDSRRSVRDRGEEKSNDVEFGSGSLTGTPYGRSSREDELGLQLAMAKSKCEEFEGKIRQLEEKDKERLDEIHRLSAREKEKEMAITTYVRNATHFEEEIQKADLRLSTEQDNVERCKKVFGRTMECLNGFLRINGVPELIMEGNGGTRWSSSRVHSSPLSIPQSHFQFTNLEQLEGLPSLMEGRLNEVLDKKMVDSHVDAIKYRSLKIQDVALFLPVQASEENTWNYHAFVVGKTHYYLSADSLASLHSKLSSSTSSTTGEEEKSHTSGTYSRVWPAFILGRIVFSESHIASKEYNPYEIEEGTEFHIITAEIFHDSCGAPLPTKEVTNDQAEDVVESSTSSEPPNSSAHQRTSLPPQAPPFQRERGTTVEEMV